MTVLDRLEALLRDASPLPWKELPDSLSEVGKQGVQDEEAIIAAVNALPALLRVARAAEAVDSLVVPFTVVIGDERGRRGLKFKGGRESGVFKTLRASLADLAKEET